MNFPQRNGSSSLVALTEDLGEAAGRNGSASPIFDIGGIAPVAIIRTKRVGHRLSGTRIAWSQVENCIHIPIIAHKSDGSQLD